MKVCSECKEHKRNREFYKRHSNCIECVKKRQAKYRAENRETIRAKQRTKKNIGVTDVSVSASIFSFAPLVEKDTVYPDIKVATGPAVTSVEGVDPREQKEIAMKRMLSGAKTRAKDKGLPFNLHYDDVVIPNICPILRIPLIPSHTGQSDNSPSLDRMVPYLGYSKGNVKVISMKANRIKSDANSVELAAVLAYVKSIEEENT